MNEWKHYWCGVCAKGVRADGAPIDPSTTSVDCIEDDNRCASVVSVEGRLASDGWARESGGGSRGGVKKMKDEMKRESRERERRDNRD